MSTEMKEIVKELLVAAGIVGLCWGLYLLLKVTPNILFQASDAKYVGIIGLGVIIAPLSRKVINMAVK